MTDRPQRGIAQLQEAAHGAGHDYDVGSPHLRHTSLRTAIVGRIRALVAEQFDLRGSCRVLEVGAGHGTFTDHVAAMGADLTVSEMSRPSLDVLRGRFAHNPRVRLVHDTDGEQVLGEGAGFDLVLCVSVLHHIPDYLGFVSRLSEQISEGGAFASFQDPLWYPRRSRGSMALDRAAYFSWRLGQPDLWKGVQTRLRRAKGQFDETNPADMVEYHVVRQGVDEQRLHDVLAARFASVDLWTYWSTQAGLLQRGGARLGSPNTFGLVARSARPVGPA